MSFHVPNKFRVQTGLYGSAPEHGNNGAFVIPPNAKDSLRSNIVGPDLLTIASDGLGWEHVSVSLGTRCPTWEEMCRVKNIFWDEEDCVMQFHPSKSEYVNNHPYCLHLWRPIGVDFPTPSALLVGVKT